MAASLETHRQPVGIMRLYTENGEIWNPYESDARELDLLLQRIVDAIRYRRRTLYDLDSYGAAVTRLTQAAMDYTAVRRGGLGEAQDPATGAPQAS